MLDLNMSNPNTCVIGEVFGHYYNIVDNLSSRNFYMTEYQAVERGFQQHKNTYDGLQREWLKRFKKMGL